MVHYVARFEDRQCPGRHKKAYISLAPTEREIETSIRGLVTSFENTVGRLYILSYCYGPHVHCGVLCTMCTSALSSSSRNTAVMQ